MNRSREALLMVLLAVVLMPWTSRAAVKVWDGGAYVGSAVVTNLASNPTNWVGDVAPVTGDDIVLDATAGNTNLWWDITNITVNSWLQTLDYTGAVTIATVYPGQGFFTNLAMSGNCILSNGVWRQVNNPSATDTLSRRLKVTIGGNLFLGSNASMARARATPTCAVRATAARATRLTAIRTMALPTARSPSRWTWGAARAARKAGAARRISRSRVTRP